MDDALLIAALQSAAEDREPFKSVAADAIATIAALRAECDALRAAAQAFIAKYDSLETVLTNAFIMAYDVRGQKYEGDNWAAELDALRALAAPRKEGERDD